MSLGCSGCLAGSWAWWRVDCGIFPEPFLVFFLETRKRQNLRLDLLFPLSVAETFRTRTIMRQETSISGIACLKYIAAVRWWHK